MRVNLLQAIQAMRRKVVIKQSWELKNQKKFSIALVVCPVMMQRFPRLL
jgi:hypothetical protein